jgi:hypothetical protein
MMFTPEQEQYLADLADKGLAELAEIEARNEQIEEETVTNAARAEKLAELEVQAQALISDGLTEFDAKVGKTTLTRG